MPWVRALNEAVSESALTWAVFAGFAALALLAVLVIRRVQAERLAIAIAQRYDIPRRTDTIVVAATGIVGDFSLDVRTGTTSGLWITVGKLPKRIRILGFPTEGAVPVGDPGFPAVTGDPLVVSSALGVEARRQFLALAHADVHLVNGKLICSTGNTDTARARALIDAMLQLARELSKEPGPAALLENALRDPLRSVRQQNAELLVGLFPESTESQALLDAIRAETVDLDIPWRTLASVVGVSRAELADAELPAFAAAARALRTAAVVDRLLHALAALGRHGERALVAIIAHAPDDAPSQRALSYLGGSASVDVIEPLRRLKTLLSGADFERAIDLIKARAEGADPGQLSLAGAASEAGAVSVVAHAGALSTPAGSRRD